MVNFKKMNTHFQFWFLMIIMLTFIEITVSQLSTTLNNYDIRDPSTYQWAIAFLIGSAILSLAFTAYSMTSKPIEKWLKLQFDDDEEDEHEDDD